MEFKLIIFFLFILIITFLLLNSGFILIIIQNIKNIIFYSEKSKEIIAEKIIYEQFSHEIYSNIKSRIYYEIRQTSISTECDSGYEIIKFPLRMEYFYDCEGIFDDKIDKKDCQDKITNPQHCCELNCCRDYIINKEKKHFCSDWTYFPYFDSRNDICSYISIYNGKFYYINNKYKYCARRLDKVYEDLLSDFDKNKNCDIKFIFDSANHYFCNGDYNYNNYFYYDYQYHYYYNYENLVAQNIISNVTPSLINIENSFRISKLLNKKEYDESKIKKELKKLNEISNKNIENAFKKNDDVFTNYYVYFSYMNSGELISGNEPIFKKFKDNSFLQGSSGNWYTRNYIGFSNIKQLKKFKKYFDENNHKNNSLYKLSISELFLYIPLVSIIIIGILFISEIIILIYILIKRKNLDKNDIIEKITIYYLIITIFSFAFFLIIYLSCFICNFDNIEIKMEKFFQRVLEKYMERREQLYLKIGIILFFVDVIILIVFFIYITRNTFKTKEVINSRPINILVIKFRLKEVNCIHKIKVDENKTLKSYFNIFENILEKCPKCSKDFIGIDYILLDNKNLNIENTIKSLKLNEKSVFIIDDGN